MGSSDEIREGSENTRERFEHLERTTTTVDEQVIDQRILKEREQMELTGLASNHGFTTGKELLKGFAEGTDESSAPPDFLPSIGWEHSQPGSPFTGSAGDTELWQPPETGFLPADRAEQVEHAEGGQSTLGTDERIEEFLALLENQTRGWKKEYSHRDARVEDAEVARREADLQKVVNKFNREQGLPPVEVKVVPDWWFEEKGKSGASAVYADGRLLVRESAVLKGATPELVEAMYHENAHHDQTALEIRHISEQVEKKYAGQTPRTEAEKEALEQKKIAEIAKRYAAETGTPFRIEQAESHLSNLKKESAAEQDPAKKKAKDEEIAKVSQYLSVERDRLGLLEKMAEHSLAKNEKEPLTEEQHARAKELIAAEHNRHTPSAEVLNLTEKAHKGLSAAIDELHNGKDGPAIDTAEKLIRSLQGDRANGGKFLSRLFGSNGVPEEARQLLDKLDQLDKQGKPWNANEEDLRHLIVALNNARRSEYEDYYTVVEQEAEHIGQRAKDKQKN